MPKQSVQELANAIKSDNPEYKDFGDNEVVNAFLTDNPEYSDSVDIGIKPKTDEERAKAYGTISEAPNPIVQFGQDVLRKTQVAGQSLLNPVLQPIQKLLGATPIKPMGYAEEKISDVAGGVRNLATAELGGGIATKLGGKIIGGIVGGATTGALQPVSEGNELGVGERVKNTAIGAGAGGALGTILKGLGAFRNIRNVDKVLYPKAEKEISKAITTLHKNIENDLKALKTLYPDQKVVGRELYDVVSEYNTLDKKALKIISDIPDVAKMMRRKVPIIIDDPLKAQYLKNAIKDRLTAAARRGETNSLTLNSKRLFDAIDEDITTAFPKEYPQIKNVYKEGLDAIDIIEPLRDRASFKSLLMKAKKGEGQAMQTALSKVLPKDLANELITYANTPIKLGKILEKNIRPRNVKPVLKRVVKNPPKG